MEFLKGYYSKFIFYLVLLSCCMFSLSPVSHAASPGTVKWKYPLPNYQLGPDAAVALGHDGTIYVPDGNFLLALDPSGTLKWMFTGSTDDQLGRPSVGKDGTIYVTQFSNGYRPTGNGVYALDTNGNLLWTFDPPGFALYSAMFGVVAIGEDGNVYATGLQESDSTSHLFSIDASGIQKWASPSDGGVSVPAIASYGRLYSMGVYRLYGVSPSNGSTVVTSSTEIGGHWRLPSLGMDGIIYVVGSSQLQAYGADGVMLWQYLHQGNFSKQPGEAVTGVGGRLYLSSFDYYQITGRLHALMPDGSVGWIHEFPYREKPVGSPAIGNDGTIYVATEATSIPSSPQETGVIAFSEVGSRLWSIPGIQPRWTYYNSPILGSDGSLYILGHDSNDLNSTYVYAINTSSTGPAKSSWPMMGANAQHTHVANSLIPKLEVSPSLYNFGNLTVGACSAIPTVFTLSNTGNSNISITDITTNLTVSNNKVFELIYDWGSKPCNQSNPTITPGDNCTVGVAFCPATAGSVTDNLVITSNDPNSPANIPLEGNGIVNSISLNKPMDEWNPGTYYFGFSPWLGQYCTKTSGQGKNKTNYSYPIIHTGIDVNVGSIRNGKSIIIKPVKAAAKGVIKGVCYDPKWAYALIIEHDNVNYQQTIINKMTSVYWHININKNIGVTPPTRKMCTNVNPGITIEQGVEIGAIADLGTGSHLHFGTRLAPFSLDLSAKGALPSEACGGNPAFNNYFVDPNILFSN